MKLLDTGAIQGAFGLHLQIIFLDAAFIAWSFLLPSNQELGHKKKEACKFLVEQRIDCQQILIGQRRRLRFEL